jgi:hypothetical protein
MPIIYDSKKIIPAPLVAIEKTYNRNQAGDILGTTFTLTVNGTLLAFKGSPTSSGTFHTGTGYPADETIGANSRLAALLRKQDALRELFSVHGLTFEIQPLDGTQSLRCNPRVVSLSFPEGIWYDQMPYTIVLEADILYPQVEDVFDYRINDAQESWTIDSDDLPENEIIPHTHRLTHNVTAVGKRFYNDAGVLVQQPWENARDYVLSRLGFDSTIALSSGVHNLPSYFGGFNHTRSANTDKSNGSFSVTEMWLISSGTALEDFTVDINSDITQPLAKVSINGTVTGLEQRDSNHQVTTSKYTNALTKFNTASGLAFSRAQNYSGYTLNISPTLSRIGKNPVTGTISYSFEYDDRPYNVVSGALSEIITISDNLHTNIVAAIPVLGRVLGPVLQDINTSEPLSRQLTIELLMPKCNFGTNSLTDLQSVFFAQRPTVQVSGIINAANPANNGFSQVFKTQDQESWNVKNGAYSRNINWIFEV